MLTLGLMRPWAAVRMARYTNEHTGNPYPWRPWRCNLQHRGERISHFREYVDMEGFDFGF